MRRTSSAGTPTGLPVGTWEANNKAMSNITLEEIVRLPVEKRLQIAEAIWDSIRTAPDAVPLTEAQRRELDRRLDACRNDPEAGDEWETVLKRIRGRE